MYFQMKDFNYNILSLILLEVESGVSFVRAWRIVCSRFFINDFAQSYVSFVPDPVNHLNLTAH